VKQVLLTGITEDSVVMQLSLIDVAAADVRCRFRLKLGLPVAQRRFNLDEYLQPVSKSFHLYAKYNNTTS